MEIQQVLAQMRALQARVSGIAADVAPAGAQPADFASFLKNSIAQAASVQNQATTLAKACGAGEETVDITKGMLEVQKAGLALQATTEVRNKLIDAYTQVMNMSI